MTIGKLVEFQPGIMHVSGSLIVGSTNILNAIRNLQNNCGGGNVGC